MQIAKLILDRSLQLLQSRFNGAALSVSQHDHQASTELLGGELDTADQGRSDDVAGDTNDEQITQALIEDDFDGHPRIGTAEYGRERLLTRSQFETPGPARNGVAIAD